eukprot:GHRQ01019020.1.p1 GENE.GHRQ01019020.1~~GHRQ01019020.1.p1  ORF type:complete len:126 (-),score=49.55 GHRQ01019020.1:599-976(-)
MFVLLCLANLWEPVASATSWLFGVTLCCRCGMVYVDSRNLGYKPYFWRWLNTRTRPGEAEALQQLIDRYAVPAIEWVAEGLDGHDLVKRPQQSVPHTNLNMAAQLCKLLDATIIDHPKMQDPQVG